MVDFLEVPHMKMLCTWDGCASGGGASVVIAVELHLKEISDKLAHGLFLAMARERRIPSMFDVHVV